MELLYIAEKLKIPVSEVSVNWTEIDGKLQNLYMSYFQESFLGAHSPCLSQALMLFGLILKNLAYLFPFILISRYIWHLFSNIHLISPNHILYYVLVSL